MFNREHAFFLSRKGFTLIELIVVVVIIGILSALAIPSYTNTRERQYDREAYAALKLIRAANKQYFSRSLHYYPPPGGTTSVLNDINNNLAIDLDPSHWIFTVASGSASTFTASAQRSGRTWSVSQAAGDPSCGGSCI